MEPIEALNYFVTQAVKRTGAQSEPALFRELRLSENYLYKWRQMLRDGNDGPTFRTILPLLEAAGVFSSGELGAEDLRRQAETARQEADRLEAQARELEGQQKPRRQRRAATGE